MAASSFARIVDTYRTLTRQIQATQKMTANKRIASRFRHALTRKNLYSIFVLVFLAFFVYRFTNFYDATSPMLGSLSRVSIKPWIPQDGKQCSGLNRIQLVTRCLLLMHQYGWWFGGFAQRPTLSAVDPQYLSLNREVDNATFASKFLDTDYIIDNNSTMIPKFVMTVDIIARHNPQDFG